MPPILVVSAFPPELAPLRRALARRGIAPTTVACVPVGIGVVDAGVGACRAIARFKPRLVVFIGTAGAYGRRPRLGDAIVVDGMTLVSTAAVRGEGYLPAPMSLHEATDLRLRTALMRALVKPAPASRRAAVSAGPSSDVIDAAAPAGERPDAVDVACPMAITRGATMARRLAAHGGAHVENLETFSVARAARAAAIPFAAVLGIANHVGPRAHEEWLRHQAGATRNASAVVERFLVAALTEPSRSSAAGTLRAARPLRPPPAGRRPSPPRRRPPPP